MLFSYHRDTKCKDTSFSLTDLTGGKEVTMNFTLGSTFADEGKKNPDCELTMIGKAVLHHYMDIKQGAWMRDPVTRDSTFAEKIWMTREDAPEYVYEWKNRIDYQRNNSMKTIKLTCPAKVRIAILIPYFELYHDCLM